MEASRRMSTSVDPFFSRTSRARVRKLREEGLSTREIADKAGISRSTVRRALGLLPGEHLPQTRKPRDGGYLPCACADCATINRQMIEAIREVLGKCPLYKSDDEPSPPTIYPEPWRAGRSELE
jgi:DNA-binding transcriptional MocR family regulator